jgi:hypothetical protein
MNARRTTRIVTLVAPTLRPGEQVEIIGRARISSAVAVGPAGAHPTSLSSTAVIADGRPRSFYVVLTGHRLIMVRRNRIAGQVLRDGIVGVAGDRPHLELSVAGRGRGLLVVFARGSRLEGERIGDVLRGCRLTTTTPR